MPRRRRLPRELFETRSQSWQAAGLAEELERETPRRTVGGLIIALVVIAATLAVYNHRRQLLS